MFLALLLCHLSIPIGLDSDPVMEDYYTEIMQGGRGGRDSFFGDPFGGFGGFGSFGPPRSLLSNFFGGRDPFNDPFFTQPFGGMFESSFFGPTGNPFPDMHPSGFLEHRAPETRNPRGPIIKELNSDDEEEDAKQEKGKNPRKHGRSNNEPNVVYPDDEVEGTVSLQLAVEKKSKHLQTRNEFNGFNGFGSQPQGHSFCFQSSTVSYGGPSGTYYTSSRTRRTGSDGVTFDEAKEANSATREASHRVSRGLHNKGHSLTRKLTSDGKVDSMQTLHNLNEDELTGFEEAWQGKAQKYLPGWMGNVGGSSSGQIEQGREGGWALPSTDHANGMGTMPEVREKVGSSVTEKRARAEKSDRNVHRRGRGSN
ncbi:myeloid leukemia factor 1 [Senna tora]|uniref:Myeloid leukemia factor 1 n=1 Tax=Senna tora TaxID=362788 RepID=A0A834W6J8_9FABA|nr:myeloid leukemia factor 1 [Senna tora]